jgi:uncharacterized protein YkwD
MLRTTAIACAIAALVSGGWEAAAASAKGKSAKASKAATCAGAYAVAVDGPTLQRAKDAVLCLVNRERAARGLGALRAAGPLGSAATGHSADMVANKFFSHMSRNGDSVFQRIQRAGYHWTAAGEAIIWGGGAGATPFKLVAALLKSPEHRAILLDSHYRDLGVGLVLGAPAQSVSRSAATLTLDLGNR